jgi:hypothetical protein
MIRIAFFTFLLAGLGLFAQAQVELRLAEGSNCDINGTSTISDWTVPVTKMKGSIIFSEGFAKRKGPKVGDAVQSARLEIPVADMKSARGETMDANIYKAFDEPKNPFVVFVLTEGKVSSVNAGQIGLRCTGDLTMAGTTKTVSLDLSGKQKEGGAYHFTATHVIDMTEYGMVPPTAMFGAIEAGKEVTLEFDLKLEP